MSVHYKEPVKHGASVFSEPLIRPKGDEYMNFPGNVGLLVEVDMDIQGILDFFNLQW